MMKNLTNKLRKATFVFLAVGIMATSTPAFAERASAAPMSVTEITEDKNSYMGNDLIEGTYKADGYIIPFKYTDGYFKVAPEKYQPHMATSSMNLAQVSNTVVENGDYSHGPDNVIKMLKTMGFREIYANDAYRKKPTTESIGFVVATKHNSETGRDIVSITIRSAGYEKEWVSNVTLGENGEAKGFASAADEVVNYVTKRYLIRTQVYKAMKKGKVDFWLQGYSRGGAVANLSAKRLTDKCSGSNNRVYAYCIEAPQGGVAEAEKKGVSYAGIHNVINACDLVPYVAPTAMGFKRYGVDHYLSNGEADEKNLVQSTWFATNVADNKDAEPSDAVKIKVMKQLEEIVKADPSRIGDYMPFIACNVKVNLRSMAVEVSSKNDRTPVIILRFLQWITERSSDKAENARKDYATKGLETALRNMLSFLCDGGEPAKALEGFGGKDIYLTLTRLPLLKLGGSVKIYTKETNLFKQFWAWLTNSRDLIYKLELSEDTRVKLVNEVVDVLQGKMEAQETFRKYPGGSNRAFYDLHILADNFLKGIQELDIYANLLSNVQGIIKNHTMIQTLAWLRSYDSWY